MYQNRTRQIYTDIDDINYNIKLQQLVNAGFDVVIPEYEVLDGPDMAVDIIDSTHDTGDTDSIGEGME